MDITKLFDIPEDDIEPLAAAKLNAMIEKAVAQPQARIAANENSNRFRRAISVAAALVIAVTVSLSLMPTMTIAPNSATSEASNGDVYDEFSDLLVLETLNDLS